MTKAEPGRWQALSCIAMLSAVLVAAGSQPASADPADPPSPACAADTETTPLTEAGIGDLIKRANNSGTEVAITLSTPEAGCTIKLTGPWPSLTGKLAVTAAPGPLTIDAGQSPGASDMAKAVFNLNKGNLSLTKFILTDSVGYGIHNNGGGVVVNNSEIKNSQQSGIRAEEDSTITVNGTALSSNRQSGINASRRSSISVTGSTISGNERGGILAEGAANIKIVGSTITNNIADAGAGINVDVGSKVDVVNSTISANTAGGPFAGTAHGGGIIVNSKTQLTLDNSTVSDNVVRSIKESAGGGISMLGGPSTKVTLINSKVTGNDANASQDIKQTFGGGIDNRVGTLSLQGDSQASDNFPNNCEKKIEGCGAQ